ncbi:MAG TPA: MaoC/PaaZ C-terminal domain-containing protein, partial [Candidatus Dormibacteraeota bacterium]|nr:MaoC/PaaZ C-terminal domain-containing protein [Candidatus Dormibacteraeota bacterium]
MSSRAVTFTNEQIAAYAEASGDHNPIHLDDDFARSVGLP